MTTSQTTTLRADFPADTVAVLADERRRCLLRCLLAADGPVGSADLARDVVARERNADARDVSADAVERCYVRLHHIHLPKLADAGYLRYDEDRTTVATTTETDSLVPLLDWAAERTD